MVGSGDEKRKMETSWGIARWGRVPPGCHAQRSRRTGDWGGEKDDRQHNRKGGRSNSALPLRETKETRTWHTPSLGDPLNPPPRFSTGCMGSCCMPYASCMEPSLRSRPSPSQGCSGKKMRKTHQKEEKNRAKWRFGGGPMISDNVPLIKMQLWGGSQ